MKIHSTLGDIRPLLALLLDWADQHPGLPLDNVRVSAELGLEFSLHDDAGLDALADWAAVMPPQAASAMHFPSGGRSFASYSLTTTTDDAGVEVTVMAPAPNEEGDAA
ncbi:hypothetical protein [Streptomyces sp. NPDC059080]|uniref:hypothetical protein n=1 Tax=Streptomyces sp. NPDC059080 TaxID=3346718 RepID=UPI0036861DF4